MLRQPEKWQVVRRYKNESPPQKLFRGGLLSFSG